MLASRIANHYPYFMPISKEDLESPVFSVSEFRKFDGEQISGLLTALEGYIFKVEDPSSIERRVQFLHYDLNHHFVEQRPQATDLLTYLTTDRGLVAVPDSVAHSTFFRLSNLCHRRQTSRSLLALFLGCVFAKYELPCVHFVLDQKIFLRTRQDDRPIFFDLQNPTHFINSDNLLHLMTQSVDQSATLEVLSVRSLIILYLRFLKLNLLGEGQVNGYLRTLNVLIEIDADNWRSTELVERGLFLARLNYSREALKDLKRYFHFCKDPYQDSAVVAAYKRLTRDAEKDLGV